MNETSNNFSTPIQTKSKRLGLKRTSSVKKETPKNSAIISTPLTRTISNTRTSRTQPHTDGKVKRQGVTSPGTPSNSFSPQRESVSTNCRPYRLALSKRMREKMTKKRLEFHMANEMEKEQEDLRISQKWEKEQIAEEEVNVNSVEKTPEIELETLDNYCGASKNNKPATKPEEMSRDELLDGIAKLRNDLKAHQEHVRKMQELREAINTWKNGFAAAFKDLQNRITPHYDNATLLDYLHIPQEMLKYVND